MVVFTREVSETSDDSIFTKRWAICTQWDLLFLANNGISVIVRLSHADVSVTVLTCELFSL